ncbi:type II toxin-antitoxin system HipA family toxin [Chlamydiales bacterium]|nr:type II toxin-antitoxin system HipA family toxin [Chlamydiales bacterium]
MARFLDVYLYRERVGLLIQDDHGQMLFDYAESWLASPNARPLSNSLPLRAERFKRNECRGFFAGILPEEDKRETIARNLGVSARNDFSLLEQIGGECAGAVSFMPAGESLPQPNGHYRILTDKDLAAVLEALPRRPLMAGEEGIRLSLAGAQDKIAVRLENGKISVPLDSAPSTHIIKPAIECFEGIVFNEAFCMQLAKEIRIPSAVTSIQQAQGIDYLLIERYDRIHDDKGNIHRLHQEDFCQALGIVPELKYQSEGGPSLRQCVDLLRTVSSVPVIDLQRLLDMVIFNFLIGNNDAHGKNFSLLYRHESTRLTPLYDALSTVYYPDLSKKMAMKVGGEFEFENIFPRHIEKFAEEVGFGKALLKARLRELAELITETLGHMDVRHPVAYGLSALIIQRCHTVMERFRPTR